MKDGRIGGAAQFGRACTINGTINDDENIDRLLKAISDNPAVTYDGLSVLLGIPRRTVSREMKKLQDSGIIEREGAKKNGRWIIKTNH